jgi:hypothetical protein
MKKIKSVGLLLMVLSVSFISCEKKVEPGENNTTSNFWYKHGDKTYHENVSATVISSPNYYDNGTSFGIVFVDMSMLSVDNFDFYFSSDKSTLPESQRAHSITLCRLNMNNQSIHWTVGDPEKDLNITESRVELSYDAGEYVVQGYCVNERNGKVEFYYKGNISSYEGF